VSAATSRDARLSVIVIARDEADRIGRCLASVKDLADEIIVLDSGSTDDTVAIARQYTDQVHETDWPGYGRQKQRALALAGGDWVLSLDADEEVSSELGAEIAALLAGQPACDAYAMRWAEVLLGRQLEYGGTARYVLRLFRRGRADFTDWQVHEKVVLADGAREGRLRGRLRHYSVRNFRQLLQKNLDYAMLMAERRHVAGRHGSLPGASLRALWVFLQRYIFRLGMLDGRAGYLLAVMHSQYTFNKYAGLWYLEQESKS
jgi:O-antigen ligase